MFKESNLNLVATGLYYEKPYYVAYDEGFGAKNQ